MTNLVVDMVAVESTYPEPDVRPMWKVEVWDRQDDAVVLEVNEERPVTALNRFLLVLEIMQEFVNLISHTTPDAPFNMPDPASRCTLHLMQHPNRLFSQWQVLIRNHKNAVILDRCAPNVWSLQDDLQAIIDAGHSAVYDMEKKIRT